MYRIVQLISILVVILGACPAFASSPKITSKKQPNIIFILSDDQHRHEFNFLPEGKTVDGKLTNLSPTIDRLASEGILFTENHVVTAICTPSRYSILTGKNPGRATNPTFISEEKNTTQKNVTFNVAIVDKDYTMGRMLKNAGYFTGGVGKNHVIKGENDQLNNGVDRSATAAEIDVRLKEIQENNKQAYNEVGFDFAASIYPGNLPGFLPEDLLFHNTDWIIKGALDFLTLASERDNPFFLYVATTVSHGPHKLGSKYNGNRKATAAGWLDKPVNVMPSQESIEKRIESVGLEDKAKDVLWLDDAIATVIKKVEEMGEQDNTIIFFMTDHGVEFGKFTCYEGGTRTPLIIWGPNYFKGNRVINAYTTNTDYLPTIAELCGIVIPKKIHVDGKSLLPLIKGETDKIHESLYHEIGATRAVLKDGWKYIAFRIPEYKKNLPLKRRQKLANKGVEPYAPYTHTCDRPGGRGGESPALAHYPHYYEKDQLYNLKTDPDEQVNLAAIPEYRDKLQEMQNELIKYLKENPGTFGEFKTEE